MKFCAYFVMQENPDVIMYRDRVLGNYPSLCLIFGSVNSFEGGFSFNNLEIEIDDNVLGTDIDGICDTSEHMEDNVYKKRSASMPPRKASPRKARRVIIKDTDDGTETLAETVNNQQHHGLPIESAVTALQSLADIDEELLLDACDLMEDEKKAKTFLALDANLRKKWLLRKLRPCSS